MVPLTWIAIALLVVGAVMLVVGAGNSGLWIAVIAVGVALAVISMRRRNKSAR